MKSGKAIYIPVDIQTQKYSGYEYREVKNWVKLEPTDVPYIYHMNTTEELDIPIEKFKVNTKAKTSSRSN